MRNSANVKSDATTPAVTVSKPVHEGSSHIKSHETAAESQMVVMQIH